MSSRRRIRASKPPTRIGFQCENIDWSDVQAEAQNAPQQRKFTMLAYTGGAMRIRWWRYPVVVDLAGISGIDRSRPIFRNHDPNSIVGHTESIKTDGEKLIATGLVSGAGDAAREVIESSRNGFPWQVSLGADASSDEDIDLVAKGQTATANGRTFRGPVYIMRKSNLVEISFVPLGADDNTSAKVAARTAPGVTNMEFSKWVESKGFVEAELTEDQEKNLRAMFDAAVKAEVDDNGGGEGGDDKPEPSDKKSPVNAAAPIVGGDDGESVKAYRAQHVAETKRVAAIRKLCGDRHADIEAQAIGEGWTEERTELEVLRAARPQVGSPFKASEAPVQAAAMEAALCLSHGLPEEKVGKWYGEKAMNVAAGRDLRGIGLHQLMHAVIRAAGMHATPGRMTSDEIRAAFEANERLVRASSGFSTVSLSGVLANVANKALLNSFEATSVVAPKICGQSDLNDFKAHTRYRMTATGMFEKVGATGELKHGTLTDETYTNQLDTYGKMLALTRQMIINDDLGAFLKIPMLMGRQAALALEDAVFTLILANTGTFFGSGNKNYISGSATVLSVNGLTSLEQKFLDQVDSDGKPVVLNPAILLVPTSLKVTAEQLMGSSLLLEAATAGSPTAASNPHSNKYQVLWSPYLNNSAYSGYSTTAWYLFANPAELAAFEIGYLRGKRTPTIESGETDFNTLGMQLRGYWDFGVAQQDSRAAAKSKGAA